MNQADAKTTPHVAVQLKIPDGCIFTPMWCGGAGAERSEKCGDLRCAQHDERLIGGAGAAWEILLNADVPASREHGEVEVRPGHISR